MTERHYLDSLLMWQWPREFFKLIGCTSKTGTQLPTQKKPLNTLKINIGLKMALMDLRWYTALFVYHILPIARTQNVLWHILSVLTHHALLVWSPWLNIEKNHHFLFTPHLQHCTPSCQFLDGPSPTILQAPFPQSPLTFSLCHQHSH